MKDRALPGPRNIAQIPELAERGVMKLGWFFKTLNHQLSANDFIAGDSYSVYSDDYGGFCRMGESLSGRKPKRPPRMARAYERTPKL